MEFQDLFADSAALDAFLVSQFGVDVVHLGGHAGRFSDLNASEGAALRRGRFLRSVERTIEAAVQIVAPDEEREESDQRVFRDRLIFHTGGSRFSTVVRKQDVIVWEGTLHDGDVLCVPFGHRAGEIPASHLVLELMRPSAVDLLTWVARAARFRPELQTPAPLFAPLSTQASYLEEMRQAVTQFLSSPPLLDVFRRRMNGRAPARRIPGEAASLPAAAASESDIVDLTAPRRLHFVSRADTFGLHTNGTHLEFPREALPVLLALEQRAPIAMGALRQEFASEMDRADLDDLVDVLAANAVIRIRAAGEGG